jgi:hypothetical protein
MINIFNYFTKYELTYHFVKKVVAWVMQLGRQSFFDEIWALQNVIMECDALKIVHVFQTKDQLPKIRYIN